MNKQVAGAALAALPVIAAVAFGSPAPALANNQPQPPVQNTGQPCGSLEINYSMQISSDDGTTKFQKITLPACGTLPQIILRTPDTNATVKYSPAIADNTKPPKFITKNGMVQINLKNKDFWDVVAAATVIIFQGGILVGDRLAAHEARIDRQRQLSDAAAQRPSR